MVNTENFWLRRLRSTIKERFGLVLMSLAIRHQIMVLHRTGHRPQFTSFDRIIWLFLANVWDGWEKGPEIIQPDTRKSPCNRIFVGVLLGHSTPSCTKCYLFADEGQRHADLMPEGV